MTLSHIIWTMLKEMAQDGEIPTFIARTIINTTSQHISTGSYKRNNLNLCHLLFLFSFILRFQLIDSFTSSGLEIPNYISSNNSASSVLFTNINNHFKIKTMDKDVREIRRKKWLQSCNNLQSNERDNSENNNNNNLAINQESSRAHLTKVNNNYKGDTTDDVVIIDDDLWNDDNSINSNDVQQNKSFKKCKLPDKTNSSSSSSKSLSVIDLTSTTASDDEESNFQSFKSNSSLKSKIDISKHSSSNSESPTIHPFSICTYNIWFGQPHPKQRMEKIAYILSNDIHPKPILVGMQEVTIELRSTLFPLLERNGYQMICQDLHSENDYGCAIAVLTRFDHMSDEIIHQTNTNKVHLLQSGFYPYQNTIMNRGLLWVHVQLSSQSDNNSKQEKLLNIFFSTTHLESYVRNYPTFGKTYSGSEQRQDQIQHAASFSESFIHKCFERDNIHSVAIITGDLNWDDQRKRGGANADPPLSSIVNQKRRNTTNPISSVESWRDLYLESHDIQKTGEEGYTYDSKENPMLSGNLRRRFDRCLAYSVSRVHDKVSNNKLEVVSTGMVGTAPIQGLEWKKDTTQIWGYNKKDANQQSSFRLLPVLPSDHYGLTFTLDMTST